MNRRTFLHSLTPLAAALNLPAAPAQSDGPRQRRLQNIGIIGGVPPDAGPDWQGSLRRMAAAGYTELESRSRGPSAPAFLAFLRETNLAPVACGVTLGRELKPGWLDEARALQVRYAVCYWPWFHPLETLTLDQLRSIADQLNRGGEQCRRAGLKLAVHNHDRDFRRVEGRPAFDRLLELTDPELVTVELDLYWILKAGLDPVDYFHRYPGRFELFHVKDMGPAPERPFVAVGAGTIDFARIFAQADQAGARHFIVELEKESNTTANAEASCRHLKQLRF